MVKSPTLAQILAAFVCGSVNGENGFEKGTNSVKASRILKKILNVNDVMLSHSTGHLCFKSDGSFQSAIYMSQEVTSSSNGGAGVYVQEYHHSTGEMYTYETFNIEALRSQVMETLGTVPRWVDALDGVKYECIVKGEEEEEAVRFLQNRGIETSNKSMQNVRMYGTRQLRTVEKSRQSNAGGNDGNNIHAPELIERREDGTSFWSVAGFIIEANKELEPIAILPPSATILGNNTNNLNEFKLPITAIQECSVDLIGCDPELDSEDRSLPSLHIGDISPAEIDFALSHHAEGHLPEHRARLLSAMDEYQNGVTGTRWCGVGVGADDLSPCPGDDEEVTDIEADLACRRHDYGFYLGGSSLGMPRNECINDVDLIAATDNAVVTAVFGKYGIMGSLGCWSYDSYSCWKYFKKGFAGYWWYGDYCEGKVARFGSDRYEGLDRDRGWGYRVPEYVCDGDLFECDGDNCSVKSPMAEEILDELA